MAAEQVVVALGHTFPKLDIEASVFDGTNIRLLDGNKLTADEMAGMKVAGIILGTARKADRNLTLSLPSLKTIVRCGMGVDNIDLAAATERGIIVCNVRDYCIEEVAVHALACALSLSRALRHWDVNTRSGAWRSGPRPVMYRPSKCTLGIIGFGQIGQALAARAEHVFGTILVFDPWYKSVAGSPPGAAQVVDDLESLLSRSDIVSVHVPLTPQTQNMLGAPAFARMKKSAYLVNVSRGGIVDEAELLTAVRAGRIAGAALDTFAAEPLAKDHDLMKEGRILLSPHVAWLSEQAEVELREHAAQEMVRVLSGERPRSQVNVTA